MLFCCHRFGDALAHLWASHKTLPAVHLAVICLHYGLILPHQQLSHNPNHPSVSSRHASSGLVDPTPTVLLQHFFHSNVFQHYPELTADYVVALDSNWLPCAVGLDAELKEAHRLRSQLAVSSFLEGFVTSQDRDALTVIVGQPVDDSSSLSRGAPRTAGRLDQYLPQEQVNGLLARAAFRLLTESRESERAIYLYQLAGRYTDVLDEMCNQLSAVLVPPSVSFGQPGGVSAKQQYQQQQYNVSQSAFREQWRSLGESFITRYLRGATQSAIMHQLTQSGAQELADELCTLVNLFSSVDAFAESDFEQALELLDGANVLPVSEDKVDMYATLKPHLKRVVDDLILMALESAKTVHQQLRASRVVASTGTPYKQPQPGFFQGGLATDKDIRMQALQSRARALVAYANKIKTKLNRQDTANIAARIEVTFV